MQVVVTGANGLLGSGVVATADARDWPVTGTYHTEAPELGATLHKLDIRRTDRFDDLVDRLDPDAVVNCAAFTDVDACESEPELAHDVNGRAPGQLADVCAAHGISFCHVSTDYVFDGESDRRYPETAETNPVQVYGASKLAGERAVAAAVESPLVVRASFLFGVHGATGALVGFPSWVSGRLRDGTETPLFNDQSVTPTRSGQAAAVILDLLDAGAGGIYHVASRSCVTPYEFGAAVCRRMGADEARLRSASMDSVERPASRPRHTCLDVCRVEGELGRRQPTLAADLDAIEGSLVER